MERGERSVKCMYLGSDWSRLKLEGVYSEYITTMHVGICWFKVQKCVDLDLDRQLVQIHLDRESVDDYLVCFSVVVSHSCFGL